MQRGGKQVLHASSVSHSGRCLIILGPSGSGKSALALELMALGARLISDDRTVVSSYDGRPVASAPASIKGKIEARGVGVLAVEAAAPAPIVLAVDMGLAETKRMPPERTIELLGSPVKLLHKVENSHFPAALLQYLRGGFVD